MKKYLKTLKNLALILSLSLFVSANSFSKPYKIGVTQIVEHSVLDSVRAGFEKSLHDNGIETHIDYKNAQGDMVTQQLIAKSFEDGNKDLILAISTPSAQAAANSIFNTPILFGAITSPEEAGILKNPNVTGISDFIPPYKLLKITQDFFPTIKKIGILYNTGEKNSEINLAQIIKDAKPMGIEINPIGVTSLNEIPSALDAVLQNSDALYLLPDNLVVSAAPLILKNADKKRIPVFSIGYDKTQIDMGVTLGISVDYYRLGYELGDMAVKILKRELVKNLPYREVSEFPIIINEVQLKKYSNSSKVDIK